MRKLPLILEPAELQQNLAAEGMVIVDLCKSDTYAQYHIPGAVYLEYPRIIRVEKPVMGLLPDAASLGLTLSALGIGPDTHVVAYDDEGGGKACRLLWTLDVIGHAHYSLLNGGLHAWANEGYPLERGAVTPGTRQHDVHWVNKGVADKAYILQHLEDPGVVLLDTRSREEFTGSKKFSERGGHIPHAVHLDWVDTMDRNHNLRLLPDDQLRALLTARGVTADREVITYCQSHHRSSHTYIVLKHLGYGHIRGYPGAWSDWGNDPNTPVEA